MSRRNSILIGCILFSARVGLTQEWQLKQEPWELKVSPSGDIICLSDSAGRRLVQTAAGDNLIRLAVVPAGRKLADLGESDLVVCDKPEKAAPDATGGTFEYSLAPRLPLRVRYTIRFTSTDGSAVLRRCVTLMPAAPPFTADLLLLAGNNISLPGSNRRAFTPRQNGLGEEIDEVSSRQWIWLLNGEARLHSGPVETLAIPLLSESAAGEPWRITHMADPYFATGFRLAAALPPRNGEFTCVYTAAKVPMTAPEERTFWTVLHEGGPEKAIDAWYADALADVPPGPDWLHDVALQHYDYLSHGGKGWFEDIDALEKLIPAPDRSKVVLTLHGWYDMLGRYTFNEQTGRLDDEWTAFPRAAEMKSKGFPTSEPLRLSKAEMHRRIAYAKDRGFRVCLYFADGMTACDGAKDIFAPDQVLAWGGWVGPDTVGKPYMQNPAHPRVYARYLAYLKALLAEYGDRLDALVWDETFHVRTGTLAAGEHSAYAGRAMMRLVRDCTLLVSRTRPGCAFLVSDCIGATGDGKSFWLDVPPYAIMAHGCYQDTHCRPEAWPLGLFPNLRNTLWSCNWKAVTRFDYTAFAVEHYRTPVATSNGWLDDKGIARLTAPQRDAVIKLFESRKTQRQTLRWLTAPAPQFKP